MTAKTLPRYRAFVARKPGSVEAIFTIIDRETGLKVFDRLRCRSGQQRAVHSSWIRGASPIPMTKELNGQGLMIHLRRPNQEGQWAGVKGIGEFWFVSNQVNNPRLIKNPLTGAERWDIGLHPENSYTGSSGCIVFLNDTSERRAELVRLSNFFKSLIGVYPYIPLESIEWKD